MKLFSTLPFVALYSTLNLFKPNFAEAQSQLNLYHISGAQFMETGRDTTADGKKFVGLVQIGSQNVVWNAERTRDKSTTAASFYNVVFGKDRSKDRIIKEAMALTSRESPEDITILREDNGDIIEIYGKKGTVRHTKKNGTFYPHSLLKRGEMFWAPADVLKIYYALTPENVNRLEEQVASLNDEKINLMRENDREVIFQRQKVVDLEILSKKLEGKLWGYEEQERKDEGEIFPIGLGFFIETQGNSYNFRVSSEYGEHSVKANNFSGGGGFRLFLNKDSQFSPEVSAAFKIGTEFTSEKYNQNDPQGNPTEAVRFIRPYSSVELLGGIAVKYKNIRIKFSGGAIKNTPWEKDVKEGDHSQEIGGTLDTKLQDWIPTASAAIEIPSSRGAINFFIGTDFGSSPMKRSGYIGIQAEIHTRIKE